MRRAILTFGFMACCISRITTVGASGAHAQPQGQTSSPQTPPGEAQMIDGVAARIEDDVLTESEVRELAAFQQLVDGQAKPRAELIRELADQWIARGEADTVKYPQPTSADVDRAYAQLMAQFPSADEFKKRIAAAGLSEAGVRRMLQQQLYLSRFLDYRFRPVARIDEAQIKKYYDGEFTSQLRARQLPIPALEDVEDTIREVLTLRAISDNAQQWLDDTRAGLMIDILSPDDQAVTDQPKGAAR
jgi:hypothetical protein